MMFKFILVEKWNTMSSNRFNNDKAEVAMQKKLEEIRAQEIQE